MKKIAALFAKRTNDQKGATVIEYALIAALISIVAILAMTSVGKAVNTTFENVNSAL